MPRVGGMNDVSRDSPEHQRVRVDRAEHPAHPWRLRTTVARSRRCTDPWVVSGIERLLVASDDTAGSRRPASVTSTWRAARYYVAIVRASGAKRGPNAGTRGHALTEPRCGSGWTPVERRRRRARGLMGPGRPSRPAPYQQIRKGLECYGTEMCSGPRRGCARARAGARCRRTRQPHFPLSHALRGSLDASPGCRSAARSGSRRRAPRGRDWAPAMIAASERCRTLRLDNGPRRTMPAHVRVARSTAAGESWRVALGAARLRAL